jgi:23S rRNA-/tRNA-specific pseudouridylate synthase
MNQASVLKTTADWAVVAKPAGWLTIPGRVEAPVLNQWLEAELGEKVFVVHRIDRETSGVVLFARSEAAHRKANTWFQEHQIKKEYDCLAEGSPRVPLLRIKAPIEGASSATQLEVKESFAAGAFWAKARPLTGRRHQIRIHLAGQGFPLLGDPKYGGKRNFASIEIARVALHARRLELPSGEVFEAEWPEDFSGWVSALRGNS